MSTKFRWDAPHWKQFTQEQLDIIKKERSDRGVIKQETGSEYGKICPACCKPNSLKVSYCTGCAFPLQDEDVEKLPDNVFLDILQGKRSDTEILFRKDGTAAWNDKFGVSRNHIDVVSEEVILDISTLDSSHVDLLERMYRNGLELLGNRPEVQRILSKFDGKKSLDDLVTAGYNYPVSVKHLHLHMVLPPFKHRQVFQYPRWHSHKKVISDLKKNGKVILYQDEPHDDEGAAEYERAMKNHDEICHALKMAADEVKLDEDPTL